MKKFILLMVLVAIFIVGITVGRFLERRNAFQVEVESPKLASDYEKLLTQRENTLKEMQKNLDNVAKAKDHIEQQLTQTRENYEKLLAEEKEARLFAEAELKKWKSENASPKNNEKSW